MFGILFLLAILLGFSGNPLVFLVCLLIGLFNGVDLEDLFTSTKEEKSKI